MQSIHKLFHQNCIVMYFIIWFKNKPYCLFICSLLFHRINGTCSHTVAVIFQLAHYKNLGLTDVPSELACTSMPQQWHKPRGPKIDAEPVSTMVFAKPKPTPRKKKPVHSMPLNFR